MLPQPSRFPKNLEAFPPGKTGTPAGLWSAITARQAGGSLALWNSQFEFHKVGALLKIRGSFFPKNRPF